MNFTYNNISTSSKNLLVLDFDIKDQLTSGLTREVIKGDTNGLRLVANHFGTKYTSVIEFTTALVKSDATAFTKTEIRSINKWLTSPKIPKKMEITYSDTTNVLYGLFTDIKYQTAGIGVVGIVFTFTADSPFMYVTDTQEYTISEAQDIQFTCNSDNEEDYTYPTVKLNYTATSGTNSDITVKSITDSNKSMTTKVLRETPIYIDSNHQILKNDLNTATFSSVGWTGDIYWLRLKSGINTLNISATNYPCTVKITCLSMQKVGEIYEY